MTQYRLICRYGILGYFFNKDIGLFNADRTEEQAKEMAEDIIKKYKANNPGQINEFALYKKLDLSSTVD